MSKATQKSSVDNNLRHVMMTIEEVAQYFRKSPSWVYKHRKLLGGKKLGGSLFFPSCEDLYERILFTEAEKVAVPLHPKRDQVLGQVGRHKGGGKSGRVQKKGEPIKSTAPSLDNPNRHGILDPAK